MCELQDWCKQVEHYCGALQKEMVPQSCLKLYQIPRIRDFLGITLLPIDLH